MKQRFRRYLAMFLSVAMVFTMLPASAAMADEAAGGTALEPIAASKFVASGDQTDENSWLIATTGNGSTSGNNTAAAFVENETASKAEGGLGSARMGGLAFKLPDMLTDPEAVIAATVSMDVTNVNTDNMGSNWTKLGLFQVDASCYAQMNNSENTYPATGGDYSRTATVYSAEKFSKTELGTATFDVTEWVKRSVENRDSYAVFRLQTVICGVLVGKTSPVLSLTVSSTKELTDADAVAADAKEIALPSSVKSDLTLPTEGAHGTTIKWSSSNKYAISNTGEVTRGTTDTEVTLTATITKGDEFEIKQFDIIVVKRPKLHNGLLAEYEFSTNGSAIVAKDLTEKYDAEVKGSGAAVKDGMLSLPGGTAGSAAAYVELPGELFKGQDTLTITTWLKNETGAGDYAAMFFGTPSKHVSSSSTANMPINYWLLNPSKGGKFKSVWTDGDDASAPYNTETATSAVTTNDEWSLYTTVIKPDKIIGYYNGEKASEADKVKTTTDFGEELVAFIGRSSYNDKFYKGGVYGVKVYNKALTQDEIWDEYYGNYPSAANPFESVKSGLKETMLGENESADSVMKPLSFPTEKNKVSLAWTSSNTAVISANGAVGMEGNTVITVTGTYDGKEVFTDSFDVTVINEKTSVLNAIDIPNKDNIRGNITLPTTAENGNPISWTSSDADVIRVTETENSGYDNTPAGVVTRQTQDTKVTLTATVDVNGEQARKEIEVNVVKAAQPGTMTDYVFAYFIGDGAGQEKIHLAISRDGLEWKELNDGEAVLESTLGTKGLRDPYICRSPEGDKFYMIATDLNIGSGTGWGAAQNAGSQAIMVWESDDLVNWGEQRMATVSAEIEAGCTWAPEFYYDDKTGEYIVFWASKVAPDYNKQRVYYCKTRDFYTFTEPKLWIEEDYSVIDTTVVKEDGVYYRFTKNENDGQKYVYIETSDSLLGEWTRLSSPTLEAYNNSNGKAVEGPCCFKFNDDDIEGTGGYKWGLLLDNWTYFAIATKDLSKAVFDSLDAAKLPSRPRHGTIMNITTEEYERLVNAYTRPELKENSIPDYAATGYTLPEKVTVTLGEEEKEATVTWDKTAEDFAQPGTVTVTGTLSGTDDNRIDGVEITKTIEVVSSELIYFIDCGVGSWNNDLSVSGDYNEIKNIKGITLRNQTADQLYSAENSWGMVGGMGEDDAVGNRTSKTDSIYANGWWARSGKNCEYAIPLESGTYAVTGYFGEWWSVTRPMNFYAQYTNSAGQTVKSEVKAITVSGSNSNAKTTLKFKVGKDISGNTAEVHIFAVKAASQDPVIAGLAVEKISEEEYLADIKTAAEGITVSSSREKMLVGDKAEFTVNYPSGFEAALNAFGLEVKSVRYSGHGSVVTAEDPADLTGSSVVAVAEGSAEVTATVTIASKDGEITFTQDAAVTIEVVNPVKELEYELAKAVITPAKQDIYVNDTARIKVSYPEGFAELLNDVKFTSSVAFSSDNQEIATVSENGTITAVAAGTATITANVLLKGQAVVSAEDAGTPTEVELRKELKATICVIDETAQLKADVEDAIAGISLLPDEASLALEDIQNFEVSYPTRFADRLAAAGLELDSVAYSVDPAGIVNIEDKGDGTAVVTAAAMGDAVVRAVVTLKAAEGKTPIEGIATSKEITAKVHVAFSEEAQDTAKAALDKMSVTVEPATLGIGEKAVLNLSKPEEFTDELLSLAGYTFSEVYSVGEEDASKVTITGNEITANEVGDDIEIIAELSLKDGADAVVKTVTKKTEISIKDQNVIDAEEALKQIGIAQEKYELMVGGTADIKITYPEGFDDKLSAANLQSTESYESSSDSVTVDGTGKVKAVSVGEATITATVELSNGTKQSVETKVIVTKNTSQSAEEKVKSAMANIALTQAVYNLTVGDTAAITVKFPEGFDAALAESGLKLTTGYSGQNASVIVDTAGKITAAAVGTAKITVTLTLNDAAKTSKSLTADVMVKAKTDNNQGGTNQGDGTTQPDTTPAKIKLSVTKAFSLGLGESTKLTATVTNKAGEVLKNQKITWSVDKKGKKAVTVKNGKITASKKKTGTATITAKTSNGKTAKVKVTVKKKPTKITITYPKKKSVTLKKGKTLKLKTKVTPSKAASYKITYKSSKKKVASVSDKGVVKALKKGTATITVKTYNGKSAKVKVTVK
ncbi:MAG: hypothetical protein HFJ04_14115 [Lachnospiraceae bacterium]|nr:hypothetical protein [Lachnospiraceae bacterium]